MWTSVLGDNRELLIIDLNPSSKSLWIAKQLVCRLSYLQVRSTSWYLCLSNHPVNIFVSSSLMGGEKECILSCSRLESRGVATSAHFIPPSTALRSGSLSWPSHSCSEEATSLVCQPVGRCWSGPSGQHGVPSAWSGGWRIQPLSCKGSPSPPLHVSAHGQARLLGPFHSGSCVAASFCFLLQAAGGSLFQTLVY